MVSLVWSVSNFTDGRITASDIALMPRTFADASIENLIQAGLWKALSPGSWDILDYADTQTTKDEFTALAQRRKADRARKARERARKAEQSLEGRASRDASEELSRGSHAECLRTGSLDCGEPWPEEIGGKAELLPPETETVTGLSGETLTQEPFL